MITNIYALIIGRILHGFVFFLLYILKILITLKYNDSWNLEYCKPQAQILIFYILITDN